MRRIFIALMMTILVQGFAYADEDQGTGKNLEVIKAKTLERIGMKRNILDEFEGCIKTANSREEIKSCRQKKKQQMESLRSERKKMKEKMKEKRKERRRDKS